VSGELERIKQIHVNVKDLDRATAFYRDVLQMTFLFSAPPGLAFFDCGGVRLMLGRADRPEIDHPSSILYFEVGDIEGVHRRLAEAGVTFLTTPHLVHRAETHDLWLADFRDSEGNILALMSERPRA
jgi:methylmalonyl-CoA/ethylmalonyl-CoA epimerase